MTRETLNNQESRSDSNGMEGVIRKAIEDALKTLGIFDVHFVVEHPGELAHGDYASNVAMSAAKAAGKVPREVAAQLLAALDGQIEYVEKIEIAGPGFINFHLARDFFTEEITRANTLGDEWGKNDSWKGKKVVVEYTDPNPFKEFHIGHLFTNSVGESIARLFIMNGADTKRVCYQGDVGIHVASAIYGMLQLGFEGATDFTAQELGKAYSLGATAYKEDERAAEEIKVINKEIYERNDEIINVLYDKGRAISLAYFESIYKIIDTKFDHYFFESETASSGKELVLANPDIFPESEGARVFRGDIYGLHTRVFVNAEGLPTYEAKELALAKVKEEMLGEYDLSIISTSNEINEYFKVLKKAMSFVYPDLALKTEHIGHGTVRLAGGKMSSRTGKVIPALDFIDEVTASVEEKMEETRPLSEIDAGLATDIAIAAVKYATLKSNILQDSTFDKEQALSFEGDSGPYLQYTHARICSVIEKATREGMVPSIATAPKSPYEIEKILYHFPEIVLAALEERAPHYVATFLTELAGAFNSFYATEKIVDASDEFAPYKLALAEAVKTTLKNGLWTLGIKAPERM